MAAEGGCIDFMFLGPPLTRPLDPLLCMYTQKEFCLQIITLEFNLMTNSKWLQTVKKFTLSRSLLHHVKEP